MNSAKLVRIFVFLSYFPFRCSLTCLPSSCAEIGWEGNRKSGIYTIYPRKWYNPSPFKVYCDLETDGGGWTVFQRRDDVEILPGIRENFTRNWADYKTGFGNLEKEFWLGNDKIYILTNQDRVQLRVDLVAFNGSVGVAEYEYFHVTDEKSEYKSNMSGYRGNAGDSLSYHNGRVFVTYDRNDVIDCAKKYKGGWWYGDCHDANLNGLYSKESQKSDDSFILWRFWFNKYYPLKRTEMKIRPIIDEYYKTCPFNGCNGQFCDKKSITNLLSPE